MTLIDFLRQRLDADEAEAARAYDAAARRHFGEFASLNFPLPGERGALASEPDLDRMEEAARPRGRPRTGVTPKRNIRVGALWDEAQAIATSRGDSMTEVVKPAIERVLRRYIRDNGGE